MPLLGKVETKVLEQPDALEVIASREEGMIETLVIPAAVLVLLWWFWRTGNLWLRIIASAAAASTLLAAIANRIQGGETRLRVTDEELLAEGNLGRLFSTRARIAMNTVSSIRYDDGGDGGISGLYAFHGWRSTLLLPYVTTDQANALIETIRRKYPSIPAAMNSGFSISDIAIFDRGDQITTLGLSDSGKGDDRPQD